jgi:hypothetical protein
MGRVGQCHCRPQPVQPQRRKRIGPGSADRWARGTRITKQSAYLAMMAAVIDPEDNADARTRTPTRAAA